MIHCLTSLTNRNRSFMSYWTYLPHLAWWIMWIIIINYNCMAGLQMLRQRIICVSRRQTFTRTFNLIWFDSKLFIYVIEFICKLLQCFFRVYCYQTCASVYVALSVFHLLYGIRRARDAMDHVSALVFSWPILGEEVT